MHKATVEAMRIAAFPFVLPQPGGTHVAAGGLSKREYFAAAALHGIFSVLKGQPTSPTWLAEQVVLIADALIAKLEETKT